MALINQTQQQYYSTASPTPFGNYQFVTLEDVINNFIVAYIGEEKIINKLKRADVAFHAQRAMQELSYDTFKSIKSQEIVVPASLTMVLPQDYVNYVKVTWSDSSGIEHVLYPASKTSNPLKVTQDTNGAYSFTNGNLDSTNDSTTWEKYKAGTIPNNTDNDVYNDEIYNNNLGQRYGIDPQYAQNNGSFYIDNLTGKIHFGSNINAKTVTLKYISDGLGTEAEMIVHKLAEDAMYKCIAYAIMATKSNVQEYIVRRFQKDKFAAVRKAKLRLSNIKLEEITQILRGKSKQIKH